MKINKKFWDEGFKCGEACLRHTDQVLQEFWNRTVFDKKMDYFDFKSWERGYRLAKKQKGN